MLLYQMAHFRGWKGPNLLSLTHLLKFDSNMANSKNDVQRFLAPSTGSSLGSYVFHHCHEREHGVDTTTNDTERDLRLCNFILYSQELVQVAQNKMQRCLPEWWVDNIIHLLLRMFFIQVGASVVQ